MTERAKGSVPENRRGAFSCNAGDSKAAQSAAQSGNTENLQSDGAEKARPDGAGTAQPGGAAADGPVLCPVCGGPAEGFGAFPIREGLLCGACAGKLSEWFPCRPETAAADIRAQLAYREENRAAAGAFHTTKILWPQPCAALDERNGAFQISSQRGRTANPDILSFRQIRGCQVEIAEQRRELFRPGHERYRPRRYEYRFEIYVRVLVEHPWFHEMRFRLHDRPIVVSDRMVQASTAGKVVKNPEYQRYRRGGEELCAALQKAMEQGMEEAERAAEGVEAERAAEKAVETDRDAEKAAKIE